MSYKGTVPSNKNKGIPRLTSKGYLRIMRDGKYRYLHRLVLQEHLGRELSQDEHVHHLDGNPRNNSVENLQIVSKAEHNRLEPRRRRKL